MDPFTIAMLVSAAVSVGSGIVSALVQEGKNKEAQAILDAARDEYGQLRPDKLDEAAFSVLGPTEFDRIQTNPSFRKAQEEGLARMEELQEGGGLSLEDKANLNRMTAETARRASSRSGLLREEMQARGIGGSGAELALRQAEGQQEADRNMQAGLDTAAQAQKRYFDAVRERTRMAGEMRGQEFGEQAQRAQAQDRINQYNQAFQFEQHQANNRARQLNNQNQLALADRRYGMAQDRAGNISGQGARTGRMIADTGQQVGNAVYSYGRFLDAKPATNTQPVTQAQAAIPDTQKFYEDEDLALSYNRRR